MELSAPLSKSQYGIYVECVSHKGEPYYNLPFIHQIDRSLDGERLLREMQFLGGAGHISFVCHHQKVFQILKIHKPSRDFLQMHSV